MDPIESINTVYYVNKSFFAASEYEARRDLSARLDRALGGNTGEGWPSPGSAASRGRPAMPNSAVSAVLICDQIRPLEAGVTNARQPRPIREEG